ncbi:hypothetical protein T484DRAFT_1989107 [Baffinella frigidus]|nr:hypothetical protein T484DRAFT_1989107 [Cryptophyta sp. CCMP2293]
MKIFSLIKKINNLNFQLHPKNLSKNVVIFFTSQPNFLENENLDKSCGSKIFKFLNKFFIGTVYNFFLINLLYNCFIKIYLQNYNLTANNFLEFFCKVVSIRFFKFFNILFLTKKINFFYSETIEKIVPLVPVDLYIR